MSNILAPSFAPAQQAEPDPDSRRGWGDICAAGRGLMRAGYIKLRADVERLSPRERVQEMARAIDGHTSKLAPKLRSRVEKALNQFTGRGSSAPAGPASSPSWKGSTPGTLSRQSPPAVGVKQVGAAAGKTVAASRPVAPAPAPALPSEAKAASDREYGEILHAWTDKQVGRFAFGSKLQAARERLAGIVKSQGREAALAAMRADLAS